VEGEIAEARAVEAMSAWPKWAAKLDWDIRADDIQQLPVTKELGRSNRPRSVVGVVAAVGSAVIGLVTYGMYTLFFRAFVDKLLDELPGHSAKPVALGLWCVFWLVIIFRSAYSVVVDTVLVLSPTMVTLRRTALHRTGQWMEPVANYQCVRGRLEQRRRTSGRRGSSETVTFIIFELVHPDPDKTIRLSEREFGLVEGASLVWAAIQGGGDPLRQELEAFAHAFRLPIVQQTPEGSIERPYEDLDKSVGELIQEGKVKVDFEPDAPPPHGLRVQMQDGVQVVTLVGHELVPPRNRLLGGAFGCFFFLVGAAILFVAGACAGILPMAMGALALVAVTLTPKDVLLYIGPDTIRCTWRKRGGEQDAWTVNTAEIEDVQAFGKRRQLVLLGDKVARNVPTAATLNEEAMQWLRNCILANISAAHKQK